MTKNWQTSFAGILSILMAGMNVYSKKTAGPEDVAAITAGIGLIAAKDSNVTGGTVTQ